jgi:hypothetical protein
MPQTHLDSLFKALRGDAAWMVSQAEDYESGKTQILVTSGTIISDRTIAAAGDLRHRAGNILALISGYERVNAQRP